MIKKKSPKQIEELAVSKFKEFLINSSRISAELNINDKGVIWDGELFIYKEDFKDTAKEEVKKISVQIKGKQILSNELLKSETIPFSVRTTDLKSYMQTPTLFVVTYVYINENSRNIESSIFCAFLTKSQIYKLLKPKKSTRTIKLSNMSNKSILDFEMFILNSLDRFNSEASFSIEQLEKIEKKFSTEKDNNLIFKTFVSSEEATDLVKLTAYSWQVFLQSKDELSPDLPVACDVRFSLDRIIKAPITIGDQQFYESYRGSAKNGILTISIDDFFFLEIGDKKLNNNIQLCKGLLTKFFTQIEFLKKLSSVGYLTIGENKFQLIENSSQHIQKKNELPSLKIFLENLEPLIDRLKKIKELLSWFSSTTDLQLNNITEKEISSAEILFDLFILHKISPFEVFKKLSSLKPGDKKYMYIGLANLYLICPVRILEDGSCSFDPINEEFSHTLVYHGKVISVFETISVDEIAKIDNLPYETLFSFFTSLPEPEVEAERINFFALRLILASDKLSKTEFSLKKRKLLLALAEKLIKFLLKNDKSIQNFQLNLIQIKARKSKITDTDIRKLRKICSTSKDTSTVCGALILLKKFKEAQIFLDKLTTKERKNFKKFPIYNLLLNNDLFFEPITKSSDPMNIKLVGKRV